MSLMKWLACFCGKNEHRCIPERKFDLVEKNVCDLVPGFKEAEAVIRGFVPEHSDIQCLPAAELVTIAAISRALAPLTVFEIGTYKGLTTLTLAINAPEDAQVFTLDLDPDKRDTHRHGTGVGGFSSFRVGEAFLGTRYETKIHQVFGNSMEFDFSTWHGKVDLVLVDADHSYDFVKADTASALKLVRRGGVIIWDDYVWDPRYPECEGVARRLHELRLSISRIRGTRLAMHVAG